MKKTILSIIVSAACALSVSAQSITWDVVKDDAYDIKNFSLAIDPLFFDLNGQNGSAMGWGLRADYLMGKTFQFNLDYRNSFGTKGYNINNKNTRNYSYLEATAGLVISHKTKRKNLPIILSQSSHSSGGYTYTTKVYIKGGVPGQVRSLVILQGGIYQMGNTLNFNNLDDSLITLKGGGAEFSFQDSSAAFDADPNKKYDINYGGIVTTSIFAGFNFKSIRQLILDVDGYGIRGNVMYSDFFIHGFFAPVLAMKDYEAKGVKYNMHYGKVSHFGWRMGWVIRKPKDQGFSMKFEFGQRPGWRAPDNKSAINIKNWYGLLTYGLYIPLKVKPVAEEE